MGLFRILFDSVICVNAWVKVLLKAGDDLEFLPPGKIGGV